MIAVGQTIFVRHGRATWRKAKVVRSPDQHGELVVRWDNLLQRPRPDAWKLERTACDPPLSMQR